MHRYNETLPACSAFGSAPRRQRRLHRAVLLSCLAVPLVTSCASKDADRASITPSARTETAAPAGAATGASTTPAEPALTTPPPPPVYPADPASGTEAKAGDSPAALGTTGSGAAGAPTADAARARYAESSLRGAADGAGASGEGGPAGPVARRAPAKPSSRPAPAGEPAPKADKKIATDRDVEHEIRQQHLTAGRLTAGEWRDLDNWSFWRALFGGTQRNPQGEWGSMETHWGFHTAGRISVIVERFGQPVVDAEVVLRDGEQGVAWRARTDNRGQAHLYAGLHGAAPAAGSFTVEARSGGATVSRADVSARGSEVLRLQLPAAEAPPGEIDVMFMVDTTGSMGDELAYLQAELGWVVTEVKREHGRQLGVRTSVNFYRDRGDEYTVRPFGFSTDLDQVLGQIRAQSAGGGGDFPEAVDAALISAVREHDWSARARARLLFLVLDAPPHHSPDILASLHAVTQEAASKGIRIIPVAGSGIDKPTEFLMRFLAVSTGGTYVFLTDHSGIGGGHIKPTIGKHEVYRLNDLLVRVIRSYLS